MGQHLESEAIGLQPKTCLHCSSLISAFHFSDFCCAGCAALYQAMPDQGSHTHTQENLAFLDDADFLKEYAFDRDRQMRFYLEGVHCTSCLWKIEKLPQTVPGIESVRLDLSTSVAQVTLKEGGRFQDVARELTRIGYPPHPVSEDSAVTLQKKETRTLLVRLGVAGMASGNIMLFAISIYAGADGRFAELFRWLSLVLFLPVLFYSAVPFFRSAWASLKNKQVSIDVPIVFGLLIGTFASVANLWTRSTHIYFDSLSTLVLLLLATRYLLRKVNQSALSATRMVHFLRPSRSRLMKSSIGVFEEVRTDALKISDLIQVLPGECFPIDGVVVEGESVVDRAVLTGESHLFAVTSGSKVLAGTWNRQAPLIVRVESCGTKTRLGKILEAMEDGQARKAPIVSLLDRVGQSFVIAVVILTAVGFLLGATINWHEAVNRALAIAIVVCPCTFALGTPLAFSRAISRCARERLLIKNAEVLERVAKVDSIYFDKTGTLTYGNLRVVQWKEFEPNATVVLLALESRSIHPVAKAVKDYFSASVHWGKLPEVKGFEEKAGIGVSGWIQGIKYAVKSGDGIGSSIDHQVMVFREEQPIGSLKLSDQVRPESKPVLDRIRKLGLGIHLISGDSFVPSKEVAQGLGIEPTHVYASKSPEQKAEILNSAPYGLMVGDGANDAVALAAAYAGVAVHGGMEVSLRAAGVYSSKPGIAPIYSLLVVARETMHVIRRNLVFAILYNFIGISIALTGHLNPLLAAILMPLSALTVFLSTLWGTPHLRRAFLKSGAIS